MTSTTLVIVTIVSAVVWLWATNERDFYQEQKRAQAQSFALLLSQTSSGDLNEQNWSAIRVNLDLLLRDNPDFVYILVSDAKLDNQIVAASPSEFQEQYVPNLVPIGVTEAALAALEKPHTAETFILRDIIFPPNHQRAQRGERVIEVASAIHLATGGKLGTLRVGISLRQVDRAVALAVQKALLVGAFGLMFGLLSAYLLARHLSEPVRHLQSSAAKIASGDLHHRANLQRADEIGALATSFNEMSAALQASFSKLQKTLESFERFVPEKFLSVIAPEGIEQIQVGVAVTRQISILFTDIRGYTSLSEKLTPSEIFQFLNAYLACMGQVINEANGFIDKYIGDAIMALFDDEATDGVLQAALALRRTLTQFNAERLHQGLPQIDIGIGIHRGEVVMGTVGFTSRIESTVIGDPVNLASRVERLTKDYHCQILVTEPVVAALRHPDAFQLRLVSQCVKIRGKDEPVAIYELQVP
ncbi:adenylate/guanylate cyclase domain-containing protein [Leptolyngbya sp. FACHB-261]|uniref:adenylate/guanylate cyclase domain-containing protein n=1 Tax=Leptolyngbya sp. FACHB-261 TaxID=2692806 RepID=UPI0016831D1F|nr:adenylate/guanylate cyclase domain-containing protein [Leptolyngbya sp. FACHB-261]MBD2103627.1 HAMP domain-containing protein [Leptolyngbya sp. FACHB-261]